MPHLSSLQTIRVLLGTGRSLDYGKPFLLYILNVILRRSLKSLRTTYLLSISKFRLKLKNAYRRLNKVCPEVNSVQVSRLYEVRIP